MPKVELGWVNVPTSQVKGVTALAREICKLKGFTWVNVSQVGEASYNHTISTMECYVETIDGEPIFTDTNSVEPADTINNWLRHQIGYVK